MVSFGRSMVSFVVWLSLSFMGGRGCKLLGIVYIVYFSGGTCLPFCFGGCYYVMSG